MERIHGGVDDVLTPDFSLFPRTVKIRGIDRALYKMGLLLPPGITSLII
jgi:hypothetical protein